MKVKMSKQPPPAPTVSAVGPCPTVIQIVGRPDTGSLPSTIAPPDHPPSNENCDKLYSQLSLSQSRNLFQTTDILKSQKIYFEISVV